MYMYMYNVYVMMFQTISGSKPKLFYPVNFTINNEYLISIFSR